MMMIKLPLTLLLIAVFSGACSGPAQRHSKIPPTDPIARISAGQLRVKGLAFARRGDLTRAQQYLSAAKLKGFDERIVVPEIVKVCIAASRLRAALAHAEPYLQRHPDDAGLAYVAGTIELALGRVVEARRHLRGALHSEPAMVDAAFSLAKIAKDEGDSDMARQHLQHYLEHKPAGRYATRAKRLLAALDLPGVRR